MARLTCFSHHRRLRDAGITLYIVDLEHEPVEFSVAEEDIVIVAEADINFPYGVFRIDAVALQNIGDTGLFNGRHGSRRRCVLLHFSQVCQQDRCRLLLGHFGCLWRPRLLRRLLPNKPIDDIFAQSSW